MEPKPIDVDECQRLFYVKDNFLYNKIDRGSRGKADELAGWYKLNPKNGRAYIQVQIGYSTYYAHRIQWAMYHGTDPGNNLVDHRKDILVDFKGKLVVSNAKSNLRRADDSQSNHNRLYKGKPPRGYYWHKQKRKWHAVIRHNRKRISLGYFDSEEEAGAAYLKAKNEIAGRFTPSDIRDTGLEMT